MKQIPIHTDHITLDAFLKFAGVSLTGGQAKQIIRAGKVRVNGTPESRRGRKLRPGDTVAIEGEEEFLVTAAN